MPAPAATASQRASSSAETRRASDRQRRHHSRSRVHHSASSSTVARGLQSSRKRARGTNHTSGKTPRKVRTRRRPPTSGQQEERAREVLDAAIADKRVVPATGAISQAATSADSTHNKGGKRRRRKRSKGTSNDNAEHQLQPPCKRSRGATDTVTAAMPACATADKGVILATPSSGSSRSNSTPATAAATAKEANAVATTAAIAATTAAPTPALPIHPPQALPPHMAVTIQPAPETVTPAPKHAGFESGATPGTVARAVPTQAKRGEESDAMERPKAHDKAPCFVCQERVGKWQARKEARSLQLGDKVAVVIEADRRVCKGM